MTLRLEPLPFAVAPPATSPLEKLRIAIVHYWFVSHRGGERVVEAIAEMFPQADLFSPVVNSESGPAKGVLTSAGTCHVCYCHSPMRYLWDFYHQYKNRSVAFWSRPVFTCVSHYMRLWDAASANRVDYFVANSRNIAARIRKHYRRDATVIYPPVNVGSGYLAKGIEDYYLVVGQLVDYKRTDLAITACNQLRRRLRIVGDGEQFTRLRKLAGPTIQFCGALSDDALHEQYAHCRALLFPGEEDFGIVPVEALSFGRPVIAYGRGGVTETVASFSDGSDLSPENCTGVFFAQQSWESLAAAIQKFEAAEHRFCPTFIKQQADRFAPHYFRQNLGKYLSDKWEEFRSDF